MFRKNNCHKLPTYLIVSLEIQWCLMLTCRGSECERCTASVPFQRVDVDLVRGAWLQTWNYNSESASWFLLYAAFLSAFLFMFTCNSIWTQARFDRPLNGYVARGRGRGRGFDQEARDGFCLGAPRQRDGRVIHVRNAHTARRADILKLI